MRVDESELPDTVRKAVRQAARKHKDDVSQAIAVAIQSVKATPEFNQLKDHLLAKAIATLVYEERQRDNNELRKAAHTPLPEQKVRIAESSSIRRAMNDYFDYAMGGRSLGTLLFSDLDAIEATETNQAAGHMFNVKLCQRLRGMGKPQELIRAKVSEAKLRKIFVDLTEDREQGRKAA